MRPWLLGSVLGLFLLVAPPALAEVTFTITPQTGPLGTRFVTAVEGLEPNTEYLFLLIDPAGQAYPNTFQTALAGRFSDSWNADPGDPLGTYTVRVVTADGQRVLAASTFTVSAPGGGPAADHADVGRPAMLPAAGGTGPLLPFMVVTGLMLAGVGVRLRQARFQLAASRESVSTPDDPA